MDCQINLSNLTDKHDIRYPFSAIYSKPGLVKVEFDSVDDQIKVLRNKQNLKGTEYNRVFIMGPNHTRKD